MPSGLGPLLYPKRSRRKFYPQGSRDTLGLRSVTWQHTFLEREVSRKSTRLIRRSLDTTAGNSNREDRARVGAAHARRGGRPPVHPASRRASDRVGRGPTGLSPPTSPRKRKKTRRAAPAFALKGNERRPN